MKKTIISISIIILLALSVNAASKYDWNWLTDTLLDFEEDLESIKEKVDYLENELIPKIEENKLLLEKIIDRDETAWNEIIQIKDNLNKYQEELNNIEGTEQERQEITNLIAEIEQKLEQIKEEIQPSLLAIHEDLAELKLDVIENKETLSLLEDIEDEMLKLDSNIMNMENINNDRYSIIYGRLDEIVENTGEDSKAVLIKSDIKEIKDYLEGDITDLLTRIEETTTETNEQLEGLKDFFEYVIYPEIQSNNQKLDDMIDKQELVWNDMTYIKSKVEENNEEIKENKAAIKSAGDETLEQLYSNEITIQRVDTKVSELLNTISLEVLPKLNSLDNDLDSITSKLQIVKESTQEIGASQEEILKSLENLNEEINKIELDLSSILRYTTALHELLDCENNKESEMCQELNKLSVSLEKISTDTEELKDGQITIKNYITNLQNADAEISEKVGSLSYLFNCEAAVINDVCFRLTLIKNYLEDLKHDSSLIEILADSIEDMKLDIGKKIDTLITETESIKLENEIIKQEITSLSYVSQENFNSMGERIKNIEDGVREITTSGIKLDFDTFLVLEELIILIKSANSKIDDVDSYLKGEIKEEIEEIHEEVEEISEEVEVIHEEVEEIQETVETEEEPEPQPSTVVKSINKNSENLDNILSNWGNNGADNVLNGLQTNLDQINNLETQLASHNKSEFEEYEESKGFINSLKELSGLFENTANNNYNKAQEEITEMQNIINEALVLNEKILENIKLYGENDLIYDNIADLITLNSELIDKAINIGISKEIENQITTMETSLTSVDEEIEKVWNEETTENMLGKINILNTKINYLNIENTEDLKTDVKIIEEELEANGKSDIIYDLLIKLQSSLVDLNTDIKIKEETENLETNEELEEKINEESTNIIKDINENQILLYELLNRLDDFNSEELELVIEQNRDNLIQLKNWIEEFRTTEDVRFSEEKKISEKLLNIMGIEDTAENKKHAEVINTLDDLNTNIESVEQSANDMLAEIKINGDTSLHDSILEFIDDLSTVLGETGIFIEAKEIRLIKGKNFITITMQPENNSAEEVFEDIADKVKIVEHYDEEWLIYNPKAPFGNTLEEINAGKNYWITMKGDAVLTIN